MFRYNSKIRSAVMIVHSEGAHVCYLGKDAHDYMIKNSSCKDKWH